MNELTETGKLQCANCSTPLEGEFCHHCGQSVRSVLRPVHHMLDDGMDLFFNVDSRIVHTLPPLLTRPGFLTLEYFAGRRNRYIAPFRLMFVLCLLAFFAFHLAVDDAIQEVGGAAAANVNISPVASDTFSDDDSAADVRKHLDRALGELAIARKVAPGSAAALDDRERTLHQLAQARLDALGAGAAAVPAARSTPAPAASAAVQTGRGLPGLDRAVRTHDDWKVGPVRIAWLPDFMNRRIDAFLQHTVANLRDAFGSEDPAVRHAAIGRITTGIFAVLPQAMVVMVPIFAVVLKLFYLFKRRLYMEHLIVAMHSHAFLFLALFLAILPDLFEPAIAPRAPWLASALSFLSTLLLAWMPVYLLIMQKRVYRQGWPMTLVKYWFVGWCYFWLLFTVLGLALLLGAGH